MGPASSDLANHPNPQPTVFRARQNLFSIFTRALTHTTARNFLPGSPTCAQRPNNIFINTSRFSQAVSLQKINFMCASKKNPPFLQRNLRNAPAHGVFVLVEKLCMVCARLHFRARTFLLPPALEWATIPRCHFPAVRGPAIPKRTRTVAGAKYWRRRGQESEDLRKMNRNLLSTAYSHLWK